MAFALRDVAPQIRDQRQACKLGGGRFPPPVSPSTTPDGTLWWIAAACTLPHCTFLQRMPTAEFHFALSHQSPVTMSPPLVLLLRANIKIFSFSNPLGSTGTQALCAPSVLIKLKSCCSTHQWYAQRHTASKSHGVCLQIDCVCTQTHHCGRNCRRNLVSSVSTFHLSFPSCPAMFYGHIQIARIFWGKDLSM